MVMGFSSATLGCMDIGAEMADSELFCQSSRKQKIVKEMRYVKKHNYNN